MLWKPLKEAAGKCHHLLIRNPEELTNGFKKRFQNESKRMEIADLGYFRSNNPEQLTNCAIIGITSLLYTQNHVPHCNDSQMTGKGVEGRTVSFCLQLQILLTGLEIYLNVPSGTISANDFFFRDIHIC